MWFTDRRITSTNTFAGNRGRLALLTLSAGVAVATANPGTARADDPAPANAEEAPVSVTAVAPEQFPAGATITISGAGFVAGDTVKLDGKLLGELVVDGQSIRGVVPAKATAGKKLTVHRGKRKLGELTSFTFVPAPKLSAASPKFASPGETVKLTGKGLATVTLTVGGVSVPVQEQSKTTLKFVVPEALQTGVVEVTSVGGVAQLKKEYEVFRAPVLSAAEPAAGFEGDSFTLKGEHLAGKVTFKLGSKTQKASEQGETQAILKLAKGSKTGTLTAKARGKTGSLAAEFTVHPTPLLTTVPKEVGAPGELKVSGKHLDAVTTWRLGQVELSPAQAASAGKVVLVIPANAPSDQPLVAVSQGREFASKKPVATVKTPVVRGLAFWPVDDDRVEGVIRGADFSSKTTFKLGGKSLKTSFVAEDRVEFTLKKAPAASKLALAAKAGKYSGAPIEVDGAAEGYRVPAAQLAGLLPTGLLDYDWIAAQLDLEVSGHLVSDAEAAAGQEPEADEVAELGLLLAQDLQRMTLAQGALCSAMTTGKGKDQAAANAAVGEVLRQSQRQAQALVGALGKLWGTLGRDELAAADLASVDAAVASVIAAGPKVQAACKNRFHGDGKLVTEASTTITLDLDRLYRPAIVAAFTDVLAQGKSWTAVEKAVGERLTALPAARKKVWQDVLKASKAAVEAAASGGVTGKGATGDKHVDPQGKPAGNAGKGKGKAN